MEKAEQAEELLRTLGDFTSKENWDKFFTIRDSGDPFEWYAEWPDLRDPLLSELSGIDNGTPVSAGTPAPDVPAPTTSAQILVPGCGNSRLSENLYDAGFHGITNIDFSKVVISDMLRRNVRSRPDMRWRVMDMTQMQLMDETFDAVLDKGGLDALMEPELGSKLGSQYLSEVKRILKSGGKFICLTLAESHVLELLFSKFRHGWKTYLQAIPQKQSKKPSFQTFMVVVVKDASALLHQIGSLIDLSSLDCNGYQGRGLLNAVEKENDIRKECSASVDILYSVEDLQLGIKGDLKELIPGRRFQLILDDQGASRFSYKAVLLDAPQQCDTFLYQCGVFLVPKSRAHEWLFSSEGGQWVVVESSKTARLIMVFLDERHSHTSMDDIQKDLSPLVERLAPRNCDNGAQIPFMMANDGVKQRNVVKKATSTMTGPIIVEDVIYENFNGNSSGLIQSNSMPSDNMMFRRLIFQRNQGLVQSEALVVGAEFPEKVLGDSERKKTNSSSKSKRRGSHRKIDSCISMSNEHRSKLKVDHSYLASSYHAATISGFILIASNLESVAPSETVKTVVIGLGAGLLPMFLHQCMPFLDIEVVELDSMILDLARDYFSFSEDKQLKVRIADGIHYVRDVANAGATGKATVHQGNEDASSKEFSFQNGSCTRSLVESNKRSRIDILIIDVDSYDLSSGLTCPAADFVEESFLLTVKESLSDQGLFVINLVTRSSAIRETVVSRMKVVFAHLFSLQLEEEVNEVLFALNTEVCIEDGRFPEPSLQLERLLKSKNKERCQNIMDTAKRIKRLK